MIDPFKRLRLLLPLLMALTLAHTAHAADTAVPAAFDKLVPRVFADGLRLVDVAPRCTGCPDWRMVGTDKVSVSDGLRAMYAYPGSGYFANVKIEKSVAGSFERDKAIVTGAIERAYAGSRQGMAAYLKAHPEQKEKFERIAAGRDYVEFERGRYKGVEYVVVTQGVTLANPSAMPAMLHIFVPERELIVTAYLMKQKTAMFATLDEFMRSQRGFIEGYIDYLAGDAARK